MDDLEALRLKKGVAERISREVRADPYSPYTGKVIGIANGQIVLVGDNLTETLRRLREIEPNHLRGCCYEPSRVEHVSEAPPVVGVPAAPDGFRGVAGFRLLNRFDYGNFGNPARFGLQR